MTDPYDTQDPGVTAEVPASSVAPDSLDAGLAAGFGRPMAPRSSLGDLRPVLLKEAEGESDHIVKPKSDAMPAKEETGDRYRLDGEIARGGMGAVLRGRDMDLGRDLAVKVLLEKYADRPEVARRFVEEAQIGGQLQHPGVVPVYDIGRFGDRPFFTMKLVKGQTLAHILAAREQAGEDRPRLLGIALKVSEAMAYAHAKGVIHRDLKPANIMVGAFGEVQVMDWGLAKVLAEGGIADEERASHKHQDPEEGTLIRTARSTGSHGSFGTETEMGSLLGTPAYMPPEQANGDIATLDRRADVFGLGAILCEILTGKPPYVGRSSEEVRRKAANGDLADATARLDACGADAELILLTKKCLSPEAIDRPKDAQEVTDGLSAYLNGVQERLQTAERERAVAVVREAEQRKKRKAQLALAAAVVGLMLGGGAFAFWRAEQAQAGRERDARTGEAVAALLGQAEESLKTGDAAKAGVVLEAAKKRSAEGGAEKEAERLKRLDADLTLLRDLDALDQFRWTWSENRFPDLAAVAMRTREAMNRFGADPETVKVDEAAARVSASVVREQITAALDRLLRQPKAAGVHALLRRVDADPYRDAVRDAVLANDRAKMVELAGQKAALEQPPGFAAFLGDSGAIPVERRRQLLQAAVSRRPGDLSLLMALGSCYQGNDKEWVDERVRWYQAAIAAAPTNFAAHNNLGAVLCDGKRDYDGALACFRTALELDPKDANAHGNLGNALKNKGQVDEAIACYRKAIELDPKHSGTHYNLGVILCDGKRDYDRAIACFRTALEFDLKDAKAHASLGVALKGKGQVNEAIACHRKAIELDPKHAKTHYNLGVILCDDKRDYDGAIACFRTALELDPKDANAHDSLGVALKGKGQVNEAIACYRKAIELDSKFALAHSNLGAALAGKGQVDEAIACYRKAIELDPKNANAHVNLGVILCDVKRDYDGAIACFRKAIELDPKYGNAHTSLGVALTGKGQVDEAISCYRKAIELDPKNAPAHGNLGNALRAKGQVDEAIACYRKAIELDPKIAAAHASLGIALQAKGQVDEAIACFRKAIELDPKLAQAHASLGVALADKGQVDEAIACLRKAIELDPKDARAHSIKGIVLQNKGQVDEAIACYRKAIELDPKDAKAHGNLGNALRAKGQVDEAIACYRKTLELEPKLAKAHTSLGVALADKGQVDEAIACFRKALELEPKSAGAHTNLGAALYGKGQVDEAIACYKKAIELDPKLALTLRRALAEAQRLAAVQAKLPLYLKGQFQPTTNDERLALAEWCRIKKLHHAATKLCTAAFATDAKLADDLQAAHRYNAACFAALAAAGQGEDAAKLDDPERTRLRKQSLDWLRADLILRTKQLESGQTADRAAVQQALRHWKEDSDLAGIRDATALAKLPADEQKAFPQLWADVAALLKKADNSAPKGEQK